MPPDIIIPTPIILRISGAQGPPGPPGDGTGGGEDCCLPVLGPLPADPNTPTKVPAEGISQIYLQGTGQGPYTWWWWDGYRWVTMGGDIIVEPPPYEAPYFSAFYIDGLSNGQFVQIGTPFTGTKVFRWDTVNDANIAGNLKLYYSSLPNTPLTEIANNLIPTNDSLSKAAEFPWNESFTAAGKKFIISGLNTQNAPFSAEFNLAGGHPWFYGRKVSGPRPLPNDYQSLVDAPTTVRVSADSVGIVVDAFGATATPDDWVWFAVPASSPVKTIWWQGIFNTGTIGGDVGADFNLFPRPIAASIIKPEWSSTNYNFYVSNWQTEITTMEYRNS